MANPIKYANPLILDNGLQYGIDNGTHLVICENMPSNYTDATTNKGSGGMRLGQKAVTMSGPSAGSPSGRKLDVDVVTDISIDVTGVMDFQAVIDNVNESLLLVAPMAFEEITGVSTGNNQVVVNGDISGEVGVDDYVTIRESTGNDGLYTVSAVSYDSGEDKTTVTMNENIEDANVDGCLIYGAMYLNSGGTVNTGSWPQTILDANNV